MLFYCAFKGNNDFHYPHLPATTTTKNDTCLLLTFYLVLLFAGCDFNEIRQSGRWCFDCPIITVIETNHTPSHVFSLYDPAVSSGIVAEGCSGF